MTPPLPSLPTPPAPADLSALKNGSDQGEIEDVTQIAPGVALHCDPALEVRGHWRSPPGRLLELVLEPAAGRSGWMALHLSLNAGDLSGTDWLGITCRSAARGEVMVRPCLRSARVEGFDDSFFDRHLLSDETPRNFTDALHIPTRRHIPRQARWRELVLFLPGMGCVWHLHDLKVFAQ